jgi:hypothetical protein
VAEGRFVWPEKKIEDLNRPSLPLDGNGFGRNLLKNLGLAH